jgi:DNA-binding MarR family transcriptional regulator
MADGQCRLCVVYGCNHDESYFVDIVCVSFFSVCNGQYVMGTKLEQRLRQAHFQSSYQEVSINLLLAAENLRTRIDRVCQEYDITRSQYNVLRILRGVYPNGHSRREILCRMIERSPDATRLIDRLEKIGYVERISSELDKRLSVSVITKKGLKLLHAMEKPMQDMDKWVAKILTKKECRALSDLCEKLYDIE